jgi:hypothetical protein
VCGPQLQPHAPHWLGWSIAVGVPAQQSSRLDVTMPHPPQYSLLAELAS